jgi:hypothetical protein
MNFRRWLATANLMVAALVLLLSAPAISQSPRPASEASPGKEPSNSPRERCSALPPSPCVAASAKTDDAYRFNAGTFLGTIVQATSSFQGNYTIVRLNLLFENSSDHSIVLAYHARTSILADELGNTYFGARSGNGPDTSVTGMGTDVDSKTDPQFILQPHECNSATFQLWGPKPERQDKPRTPLFRYDVALDELDLENPRRVVRQHALYFGDFTPTSRTPISIKPPALAEASK